MALFAYGQDFVLDRLLGSGSPSTGYVALLRTRPSEGDTGSDLDEPDSGDGYARIAVSNNSTNWPAASDGRKANGETFTASDEPTATWGRIRFWAWCDAASGGNAIAFGRIRSPRVIGVGSKPRFPAGEFEVAAVFDDGLFS